MRSLFVKGHTRISAGTERGFYCAFDLPDLIWKSVNVSESGKYRLTFRVSTPEPRKFYVQVNGGAKERIWISKATDGFSDTHLDVELKKGVHTVRLTNAYGKTPDIDLMRVEKR